MAITNRSMININMQVCLLDIVFKTTSILVSIVGVEVYIPTTWLLFLLISARICCCLFYVCWCVLVCMWRSETTLGVIPQISSTFHFSYGGLSLAWIVVKRLSWIFSKPKVSTYLCLPALRLHAHQNTQVLGIELRSSCLQHLY